MTPKSVIIPSKKTVELSKSDTTTMAQFPLNSALTIFGVYKILSPEGVNLGDDFGARFGSTLSVTRKMTILHEKIPPQGPKVAKKGLRK